jgi:outer membrane protein
MKLLKQLFTAALLMVSTASFAQSKVAHIEVQKLISEMPEVIAAQKEIAELEKTYSTDLENSVKEYQAKAQTYAADAENKSEIINQKRRTELEGIQQSLEQFRQQAAQDLQKKQVEMMRPLYEKARTAIEKVASAQGYDYVLDSSAGGSVIMSKGTDLMADVKTELGF